MKALYWTTNGIDMWRVAERRVFEFKNLDTGKVVRCGGAAGVIDAKFVPVTMPDIRRRPAGPETKAKTEGAEKNTAGTGKASRKKSNYKGVRCEGRKYSGQYWDKKEHKLKYLGMFEDELLAAAAVQEAAGNKKEAMRLREEYAEGDGLPHAGKSGQNEDPGSFPSEQ